MIHRSFLVPVLLALLAPRGASQLAESARLAPHDEHGGDRFGSVALAGDLALVGACDVPRSGNPGAAYVFERMPSGGWNESAELRGSASTGDSFFGGGVALAGRRLAVSAFGDADLGPLTGSVYVFAHGRHGGWRQEARLMAADAHAFHAFGTRIALDGRRLLTAAALDSDAGYTAGACYVFERDPPGSWRQVAKFTGSDTVSGDSFGRALALDGKRALVAADTDEHGRNSGSVYVFERQPGGAWVETAKLVASDAEADDSFGCSVALSGERALVGAFLEDATGYGAGAAYVFERAPDGVWTETAKLVATDATGGEQLGGCVSLSGDRALVGASGDAAPSTGSGSAYLFERGHDGAWRQTKKLVASDGARFDSFGQWVSLDRGRALVGAPHPDVSVLQPGTAYVFELDAGGADLGQVGAARRR